MRKRSKYRPKEQLLDPLNWVISGMKPVMTATEVMQGILDYEKGERIRYAVADPSIFIRNGGPSIAESMFKCAWRRADNKREPGWEALRQRLVGVDNVPMLYIGDQCEDTIRTLPVLQHDEGDPEDLDTDAEDHAADELRYAVMSRPWRPAGVPIIPKTTYPKLPSQMTFNEIIAKRTAARKELEYR